VCKGGHESCGSFTCCFFRPLCFAAHSLPEWKKEGPMHSGMSIPLLTDTVPFHYLAQLARSLVQAGCRFVAAGFGCCTFLGRVQLSTSPPTISQSTPHCTPHRYPPTRPRER
jgi:hypothetical protein